MQLQRLVFPTSSYISQPSPLRVTATPPPTLANSSTQRSGNIINNNTPTAGVPKQKLRFKAITIEKVNKQIAKLPKAPSPIEEARRMKHIPRWLWNLRINHPK